MYQQSETDKDLLDLKAIDIRRSARNDKWNEKKEYFMLSDSQFSENYQNLISGDEFQVSSAITQFTKHFRTNILNDSEQNNNILAFVFSIFNESTNVDMITKYMMFFRMILRNTNNDPNILSNFDLLPRVFSLMSDHNSMLFINSLEIIANLTACSNPTYSQHILEIIGIEYFCAIIQEELTSKDDIGEFCFIILRNIVYHLSKTDLINEKHARLMFAAILYAIDNGQIKEIYLSLQCSENILFNSNFHKLVSEYNMISYFHRFLNVGKTEIPKKYILKIKHVVLANLTLLMNTSVIINEDIIILDIMSHILFLDNSKKYDVPVLALKCMRTYVASKVESIPTLIELGLMEKLELCLEFGSYKGKEQCIRFIRLLLEQGDERTRQLILGKPEVYIEKITNLISTYSSIFFLNECIQYLSIVFQLEINSGYDMNLYSTFERCDGIEAIGQLMESEDKQVAFLASRFNQIFIEKQESIQS